MSEKTLSSGIVKRNIEVNNVVGLWREMCLGDAAKTLCEFYGIPGIGKTELVKQIESALQNNGALCAHLDFDPVQNPWGDTPQNESVKEYYEEPKKLFEYVLKAWRCFDSSEFEKSIMERMGQSILEPGDLTREIVQQVGSLASQNSVVLICDETDKIDWTNWDWFLEDFVLPLVLSKRCLIIWINPRRRMWKKYFSNASDIVEPFELEYFEIDHVRQQLILGEIPLDNQQITDLSDMICETTGGHPMAAEAAIRHIQDNLTNDNVLNPHEIIRAITERVIENYMLQDNPLELELVCLLSLMRVDDELLYKALANNTSGSLPPYAQLKIKLMSNSLAGEFSVRYLKNPIADWLNQYFGIVNPDQYLEKQDTLIQACRRLGSTPDFTKWIFYTVEQIYHAACANRVEYKYNLVGMLTESRQHFSESGNEDFLETAMEQLSQRLQEDRDIRKLVGDTVFDQLVDVCLL